MLEKKAQVEGDEWSKIFEYDIQKGKVLDKEAAEAVRRRQVETRNELNRQMAELEARKKADQDEAIAYFHSEQVGRVERKRDQRSWPKLDKARSMKARTYHALPLRLL